MEVILIQGAKKTGKTTFCKIIEEILISIGYKVLKDEEGKEIRFTREKNGVEEDFTAIYVKGKCKIIINSESETNGINNLNKIFKDNSEKYSLLITAIRPEHEHKQSLNNKIKMSYNNSRPIHTISLEKQKADYNRYITKVLFNDGIVAYKKIISTLNCKIEIDCSSIIKKC